MAVRLISDTERNVFEFDGSRFYYRRISSNQAVIINKKHLKRGVVDQHAAGLETVQWCLIDWEHVLDGDGLEIPFSKDLVPALPDDLVNELHMALRESSPVGDQLGN